MDLSIFDLGVLSLAALFTSTVSGFLGMAGGIMLLAVMAQYFDPMTLIPLHGVIQLASNSSRAYVNKQNIEPTISKRFFFGAVAGALLGLLFVPKISDFNYKLYLGVFILFATWLPKFKSQKDFSHKFTLLGFITTFASLFVGATGPLKAPFFLRHGLDKRQIVATKALCQSFVHSLKLIVFLLLGFSFTQYWQVVALMVPMVFLGSYLGKLILGRLPDKLFMIAFKLVITGLAMRMIWQQLQ